LDLVRRSAFALRDTASPAEPDNIIRCMAMSVFTGLNPFVRPMQFTKLTLRRTFRFVV
jgi:hypothetical protein